MAVQPETLDAFDDRRLVAAFKAGDEDAFAHIVGTHYSSLLAEARRRLRTVGDAEDAVQETLLRAYLALDRFGGEYHLRAWLSKILSNVCADAAHKHAGELRIYDRLAARREVVPEVDEGIDAEEIREKVRKAVEALPDSYRIAFVLREVEERPYPEVASTLSVTEPNARARVHRARSALQKSLRNTSATLGGILIPVRLWAPRWMGSGRLSSHFAKTAVGLGPEASGAGPTVGVGQRPTGSFSSVSQGPLSQVSQALTQAVSSPVGQTFVAVAPEVGRNTIPVAGALATLAAAGAAMVVPGAVGLPAAASGPVAHVSAPAAVGTLTSYSDPDSQPQVAPDAPASAPAVTVTSSAVSDPSDLWSWVGDAASGVSAVVTGATASGAGSAASTGGNQTTTIAAPSGPPCPWLQSFQTATPPGISLPPALPGGAGATAYFSTGTISLVNPGSTFEASGTGGISASEDGSERSLVTAFFGACLPSTSTPALVANLTQTDNPTSDTLQLRGALVTATTNGDETDALYRGAAVWVDGPGVTEAAVPFVAEVAVQQDAGLVVLRVAFFGPVDQLLAQTAASINTPVSGASAPPNCGSAGGSDASSSAANGADGASTGTSTSGCGASSAASTGGQSSSSSSSTNSSTDSTSAPGGSSAGSSGSTAGGSATQGGASAGSSTTDPSGSGGSTSGTVSPTSLRSALVSP